ncbi:MAG: 16S rRNA (guanine(966)-N(2))-methyltransferase RsmD [Clostridiales bacterium]|nr:16S rRNA (guanine(966)-N(2))-methyltransferase RsmD [Clostridiales bacterium]
MRVIAGTARGIKLNTIPEMTTRPTVDRVKENMFNIIQHDIYDSVVLDLFSGSGSLCIECLSRGAKKAYFIEKNPKCIAVIIENLGKTKLSDQAEIINNDFENFLLNAKRNEMKFDIIFLDPPHKKGMGLRAMEIIAENNLLNENGIIVVEHHPDEEYSEEYMNLEKYKYKKYGNTSLSFYHQKEE